MRNFKKLDIWQKGMNIAVDCFKLIENFPSAEKFALSRQITRAAVSIPSNIAEGNSRTGNKEKRHFTEIALGSAFELETQIRLAQIIKFGDLDLTNQLLSEIDEEQKMITSFIHTLNEDG